MKPNKILRQLKPLFIAPLFLAGTEAAHAFASPCPSYEESWAADSFLDRQPPNFKEFLKQLRLPGASSSSLKADLEKLPSAGRKCATVMACFRNNKWSLEKLGHSYGDSSGSGLIPSTGEARDLLTKLERDKGRYQNCEELQGAAQEEVKSAQTWQNVLNGFRVRH